MQTIEPSLEALGFTQNEIIVYNYLLRKGLSAGRDIYTENELDKSSAYEAISNLNKKGFVYSVGASRNQQFGAIPAKKLFELVETREKELKNIRNNISDFVEGIDEYTKQHYKNKNVRIIEGPDGFKTWAYDRLNAPTGSYIREISSNILYQKFMKDQDEFIRYSAEEMPKERIKRNIHIKALMNPEDISSFPDLKSIEITDPAILKEVRLFPKEKDFSIESSLVTYGDYLALLRHYKGEFLGLIIQDKLMSSLANNMFDFIWPYCTVV